jgi:ureidoacrylate peracid hydrolase
MDKTEWLARKVVPPGCALVIIDVQNDYCHENGALNRFGRKVSDIRQMVPRLKEVVEKARQIQVPVVHVRMANNEFTKSDAYLEHRSRRSGGNRQVCQEGSWGAEFYEIEPRPGEPVVTKNRYSAFVNTNFETILRAQGVKTVILAGVTTDVCVESTARDAFMRDYHVLFLSDCTGVDDPAVQQATLERIDRYFGHVVSSGDVVKAWDRRPKGKLEASLAGTREFK